MSCLLLTKLIQSVLKGIENLGPNHVDISSKILKSVNWLYISSSDKPADIATREYLPNSIVNNRLWCFGSEF